ncbi:unnamed protein product, partial [Ectocarpus sp. 13 AM-2016]
AAATPPLCQLLSPLTESDPTSRSPLSPGCHCFVHVASVAPERELENQSSQRLPAVEQSQLPDPPALRLSPLPPKTDFPNMVFPHSNESEGAKAAEASGSSEDLERAASVSIVGRR